MKNAEITSQFHEDYMKKNPLNCVCFDKCFFHKKLTQEILDETNTICKRTIFRYRIVWVHNHFYDPWYPDSKPILGYFIYPVLLDGSIDLYTSLKKYYEFN